VVSCGMFALLPSSLNLLSLGGDVAATRGVDVTRAQRLAFLGAGDRPMLAANAAAAVDGKAYSAGVVKAAQDALAKDLAPPADLYHSSATKLHLARVLTGRALAALGG